MAQTQQFDAAIEWTGNRGSGTSAYRAYDRNWVLAMEGKPIVHCSNDPVLGGDPAMHNPEDLLLAAVSSCHMLWYLHLCSVAGVAVTAYRDEPMGLAQTAPDGAGQFEAITLRPKIMITAESDPDKAESLHGEIHKYCLIARSLRFPVTCEPEIAVEAD